MKIPCILAGKLVVVFPNNLVFRIKKYLFKRKQEDEQGKTNKKEQVSLLFKNPVLKHLT